MFSKVMLISVSCFVIGIIVAGFVFSQGGLPSGTNPFAWSSDLPANGVWHDASEIYCESCIQPINLARDSVTTQKILDGEITNADISAGATISPFKIEGINGRDVGSITFGASPTTVLAPTASWSGGTWVNKRIAALCEPTLASELELKSGATLVQTSNYETTYNYHTFSGLAQGSGGTVQGLSGDGWSKVYEWVRYTTNTGAIAQRRSLYMRPDDANAAQLEVGQVAVGIGTTASWRCVLWYGS